MSDKTVDDLADRESAFPWVATKAMQPGMTLRDWFAGQALGGLLACPTIIDGATNEQYARISYAVADAMLAAREQKS